MRKAWGVEIRELITLRAIGEKRSFSAAAAELGYTQSAVSQQLAKLERTVGARLVERPGGSLPISLTPVGERLAEHAAAILGRLDLARSEIGDFLSGTVGTLHVGVFESVAVRILPQVLRHFRRAWPQVDVVLVERSGDEELLRLVTQGQLDVTFAMLPVPEGEFAWRWLLNGQYVLLTAADSRLAALGQPPELDEIAGLPLIAYQHVRRAHRMEEHLEAMGFEPQVVFRTDNNAAIQRLVGVGFGAALVPELAVDPGDDRVAVLHPLDGLPPFTVGLSWHQERHLSAAAEAFIETATRICVASEHAGHRLPGGGSLHDGAS